MDDPGPEPIDPRAAIHCHFSSRHATGTGRCLAYALLSAALAYGYPLGLFMIAAHGLAHEKAPSAG